MAVYLIHLKKKLEHAEHYIGFVKNDSGLEKRLTDHLCGQGARFLEVCFERGIEWEVVRVWFGADRGFERRLKRNWHGRRICPVCDESALRRVNDFPNGKLTTWSK